MDSLISPGHSACAGCGAILAMRKIINAAGKDTVVCLATGCMEITTTSYPNSAWNVPLIHVAFENAAAVASGVSRALKKQGKENVNVIAMGGDGGMADIGFQAISGALERNENILIIMYDNEAYMNTGIQRSGSTPLYADTTTSPSGKVIPGKQGWKKDMAKICAAHDIPYVATSSIGYPADLEAKVKKALTIRGAKFIQVLTPCPIGWRTDSSKTIDLARLAVETGVFIPYEIENGKTTVTVKPDELKPVKEYLAPQGRFKHLKEEQIAELQKVFSERYAKLLKQSE